MTMDVPINRPLRLLSEAEVLARIPVGRSKLFAMIKAGEFPASVPLGTAKNGLGRPARVGWAEHEVNAWIADAIRRRPSSGPTGSQAAALDDTHAWQLGGGE